MKVTIDRFAGFCFGVENAIQKTEEELGKPGKLFSLGDIVHNDPEIERLTKLGLATLSHQEFEQLIDARVMIRAHGEPPKTYEEARQRKIRLINATCPIVRKLQGKIAVVFAEMEQVNGIILIYGKKGHPEVVGLEGQTNNKALVILAERDLKGIDFSKPIRLFSQTTMSLSGYEGMKAIIQKKMAETNPGKIPDFKAFNSICGQMSRREPELRKFAKSHDVMIFVSGKNSSNGRFLFEISQDVNPKSWMVSDKKELRREWFKGAKSAGVSGATSTPLWLLRDIAKTIEDF